MQLDQVKAIVTGAASGMGRHFVVRLAEAGAAVLAADIDAAALDALVDESSSLPGKVVAQTCNVADEAQVEAMTAAAWQALGGCNVLINNAGIFRDGLLIKKDRDTGKLKKMSLAQWQSVIDVDLTGPFLCTREFAARLVEEDAPQGVVVNISSISRHGNPGQGNYSAAKAGLIADTALWAKELARYGIRVGAVAPGFVDTPILQGMRPDALDKMLRGVPLGRSATPDEIFLGVRFIVECEYFTGRCLDIDGGLTL